MLKKVVCRKRHHGQKQERENAATKSRHLGDQEPIINPYGVMLLWI
jgi:hypothetical protein